MSSEQSLLITGGRVVDPSTATDRIAEILIEDGVITWDKVVEIADVLTGKAPGRTEDKQIILYKNQGGQGVIDIALAKRCYELARQHGKGYELNIRARENWWVQGGRAPI